MPAKEFDGFVGKVVRVVTGRVGFQGVLEHDTKNFVFLINAMILKKGKKPVVTPYLALNKGEILYISVVTEGEEDGEAVLHH